MITISSVSCVLKNLEHTKGNVMKNKYLFIIICVGNFLLTSSPAFSETYAEETEIGEEKAEMKEKDEETEEIVVTASKLPQKSEEITHKIDILTQEDIQGVTYTNRNLSEALRYTPGAFVNPLSRNDANWGSYGGLGPKYNIYMLDGLPVDSFVDTMSLDNKYLNTIEVHRGPTVLYPNYMSMDFAGNQSPLAGATNLITKDKILSPMTTISTGYGSWNTLTGSAYHENSKGNVHYLFGANYEQSDYTNYGTNPSWLNMLDDPEYKKTKAFFKTTYYLTPESKVSIFAHHTEHTGDVGRPNRDFKNYYDTINAAYENQLNKDISLHLKAGYRHYDRNWEEDNFPVNLSLREKDRVVQHIFPADVFVNYEHTEGFLLTIGSDLQHVSYKTEAETNGIDTTGNDVNADACGLYVQEKLIIDNWVFRVGGRYSYTRHDYDLIGGSEPSEDSKSWDRFLWSTGIRYNVSKDIGIYANADSTFLVPSAKSVGGTLKLSDLGMPGKNGQLPNLSLKPEKGIGLDLGSDIRLNGNLQFGARGFYNRIDDAIVENVVSGNPSQTRSVNAGESYAYGVEIEGKYQIDNMLKCFANTTITKTKVENDVDSDQDGSDVPFVPDIVANFGITASFPYEVNISPYCQYIGRYYDSTSKGERNDFGRYVIMNMKAQKQLYQNRDFTADLVVDVNNILNKKFEMPWQFQDPGFNTLASIVVTF